MGNSNEKNSGLTKNESVIVNESENIAKSKLKKAFHSYFILLLQKESAVHLKNFQTEIFPYSIELAEYLFNLMTDNSSSLTVENYCKAGNQIVSSNADVSFYVRLFAAQKQHLTIHDFTSLIQNVFSLSQPKNKPIENTLLQSMCQSLFHQDGERDIEACEAWIRRCCPHLVPQLHSYVCSALLGDSNSKSDDKVDQPCNVRDESHVLNVSFSWSLGTSIDRTYIPVGHGQSYDSSTVVDFSQAILNAENGWQLLYSSVQHGLSFNRFKHHVLSYKAPTVLVMSFEKYLFCIGVDMEWQESTRYWGDSRCFIHQILPEYKNAQSGMKMVFLNTEDRTVAKGLRFGSDAKNPLLIIDEEFVSVKYYWVDYKIQNVEVWGCGGASASQAQQQQRKWELKETEKQKDRKLRLLEDWKDNPDKQLLEMGGVRTEHAEK